MTEEEFNNELAKAWRDGYKFRESHYGLSHEPDGLRCTPYSKKAFMATMERNKKEAKQRWDEIMKIKQGD